MSGPEGPRDVRVAPRQAGVAGKRTIVSGKGISHQWTGDIGRMRPSGQPPTLVRWRTARMDLQLNSLPMG